MNGNHPEAEDYEAAAPVLLAKARGTPEEMESLEINLRLSLGDAVVLKSGDVVVLELQHPLPLEHLEQMRAALKSVLEPRGIAALVLNKGVTVARVWVDDKEKS